MKHFYSRFKITITVFIVGAISVLLGQIFYVLTLLSKGFDNLIKVYKSNVVIGNTMLIGSLILFLLALDAIRYYLFENKNNKNTHIDS